MARFEARSRPIRVLSTVAPKSGTSGRFKDWSDIIGVMGQLSVTDSFMLPPADSEHTMRGISENFRLKALACERISRGTTDRAIREAWVEIAIEWHALAHQTAQKPRSVRNFLRGKLPAVLTS
jgi:hypothetical protein